jgi:dihydrofolate reductase
MHGNERKIIVYIAVSADGYIARPDGGVEWLNRPDPEGDYGMPAFLGSIDTILWGRKTWEVGRELGGDVLGTYGSGTRHYVFSRTPHESDAPNLEWVSDPVPAFAQRLRATPGKNVWMMGGAQLIAAFLDAGELDEFMIFVIPVFIGQGIPLIAPARRNVELRLQSTEQYDNGVVQLHYLLDRSPHLAS